MAMTRAVLPRKCSRFGQSLTAIAKLAPDADIGEGLAVNYSGGASMPSDISAWLEIKSALLQTGGISAK